MDYIAVKDLKAPKYVRERLRAAGDLMIMNNGKPMALLLDIVEGEEPTALLDAVREARVRLALSRMRSSAKRAGSNRMSLSQINDEIRAARKERHAGR